MAGLVDGRRTPFVWITVAALKAIREGIVTDDPTLSSARSVYGALVEVANEQRCRPEVGGDSESFTATRDRVADLAGTSSKTVSRSLKLLERVGVLEVERRENQQLPNVYVLVEPTPDPRDSESTPRDTKSHPPGTQSPGTTQEVKKKKKRAPKKRSVDGKAVTEAELELAAVVVSLFNEAAGTGLSVDPHLTPIVMRIREKPKYVAGHHRRIIKAVFAGDNWWTSAPTPRIIYGNAAQFEASIELARAAEKRDDDEIDINAEATRMRKAQGLE